MGNLAKWIWAIIIALIAIAILELFTPWGAKARSAKMGQSVQSALTDAGFSKVTSTMSGNVARLSGEVTSEDRKSKAIATAENAQCSACNDRETGKRWHEVNGEAITVNKPVVTISPYRLDAVKDQNGGITLDGYVPSETAKAEVLQYAESFYPGQVTDNQIKVAAGAPNADWGKVAGANLGALSKLDWGEFHMEDTNSVLTGHTTTAAIRSEVNGLATSLPSGYNGAANISVPEMKAENAGEIKSANFCQNLFDSLKGDNKIYFAYDRAELRGAGSAALVETLASAAIQCSTFQVSVEGHTDSDGNEAYNQDLSHRRAKAVADQLISLGVSPQRVTFRGYGETVPVASNDTPAGKEKNRRIEFKVTRSK